MPGGEGREREGEGGKRTDVEREGRTETECQEETTGREEWRGGVERE